MELGVICLGVNQWQEHSNVATLLAHYELACFAACHDRYVSPTVGGKTVKHFGDNV